MDVHAEGIIRGNIDELFAYATDPVREPAWIGGISESEPMTDGPVRVGSKARRVASFAGRRIEYTPEVIELAPPHRLVMRTDKPFAMTITYTFREEVDGTWMQIRLQGGPGGLLRFAEPLMAVMARRGIASDIRRLRQITERG